MNLTRHIIGISLGIVLCAGAGLAAEPAEVEKFVKARIEIGEMMTNYFQGVNGSRKGRGRRLSRCVKWARILTRSSASSWGSMI